MKPVIRVQALTVGEIPELNLNDTLYISDFRAIAESLDYEIYAMYAYEGLSKYLIGNNAKNSYSIDFTQKSSAPFAPIGTKHSESVAARLIQVPDSIRNIWTAIPHPDIDIYASIRGLKLNYSYSDLLKYNNKISQKKLLGKNTPNYNIVETTEDVYKATTNPNCFIKIAIGSGGYNIYDMSKTEDVIEARNKAADIAYGEWYIEDRVEGVPMSIQVYKSSNQHIIFGLTEQYLENGSKYSGSNILNLNKVRNYEKQLRQIVAEISPLIENYAGFYGIDFFLDDNKINVLEINVRLTAATIPVLLANAFNGKSDSIQYFENFPKKTKNHEQRIVLTNMPDGTPGLTMIIDNVELVQFAGKSHFIHLANCKSLEPRVSEKMINQLSSLVNSKISRIESKQVVNFWPYGWTISFVLSESHIVFSSWYLEKNIYIDLFCCKDIKVEAIARELKRIFNCNIVSFESQSRKIK